MPLFCSLCQQNFSTPNIKKHAKSAKLFIFNAELDNQASRFTNSVSKSINIKAELVNVAFGFASSNAKSVNSHLEFTNPKLKFTNFKTKSANPKTEFINFRINFHSKSSNFLSIHAVAAVSDSSIAVSTARLAISSSCFNLYAKNFTGFIFKNQTKISSKINSRFSSETSSILL